MSRIGKQPIELPQGVQVNYAEKVAHIKGPRGEHRFPISPLIDLEIENNVLRVLADYQNDTQARCMMGTTQSVLQNMVTGVSVGFEKKLQLVGVGYRAKVEGKMMELQLGFSKPVLMPLPENVKANVENNTLITLSSHDNVILGQFAAQIRAKRPPEPYQGKGVLYQNERIRRKAGKSGKK